MAHPTDTEFRALLKGTLPEKRTESVQDHLENCEDCRAALDRLSGAGDFERQFSTEPLDPTVPLPASEEVGRGVPDAPSPNLPTSIGPYEILSRIAAGGMGIVYQARDPALDRLVAVKVLSPALAADEDSRTRFLREAAAAAAIEHPNIVPIYAVEPNHDPPYLVMRYIEGGTLQNLLDENKGAALPESSVTLVAHAVASALAAAHEGRRSTTATSGSSVTLGGLIHRDIKPSNILLEQGERTSRSVGNGAVDRGLSTVDPPAIYLTDFGLARAVEGHESLALTRTGAFLGTPQYMSPEQATGSKDIDARSDLFSFGAVLYAMATGRPPFVGDNFAVLSDLIREHAPPPPRELNPDLSPWLAHLITRLLAKKPEDRPQSAAEVAETIAAKSDLGTVSLKLLLGQRSRLWRQLKFATITVALAITAIATFVTLERTGTTGVVNRALAAASGDVFTLEGRWGTYPGLPEVIDAARAGDAIVLRTNEVIPAGNVTIPDGKNLTIRAAIGFQPSLVSSDPSKPLLTCYSSLRLERLTLRQDLPVDETPPVALLRFEAASGTIDRCHLERTPRPRDPAYPPVSERAVISLMNGPRLEVTDTRIIAPGSTGIGINNVGAGNPTVVRLENNWLRVTKNVFHNQRDARIRIEAHRNYVHGACFLEYRGDGSRLGYELESRNNLFYLERCFIDHPGAKESRIRAYYTWEGAENVFVTTGPLVLAGYRTPVPEERFRITFLRDLRQFFDRRDQEEGTVFTLLRDEEFPAFEETLVPPEMLLESVYSTRGGVEALPDVGPDLDRIGP